MHFQEVTVGQTLLATLDHGESLEAELARVATEAEFESAWFVGWGAVEDISLVTFDQDELEPAVVSFTEPLELPMIQGTITRRDTDESDEMASDTESPTDAYDVTARALLARPSGQAIAGVLDAATVYGVEVRIDCFEEQLSRTRDETTGMNQLAL